MIILVLPWKILHVISDKNLMISRNQVFWFQKRKLLGATTHKDFIFLENFEVFSLAISISVWKICFQNLKICFVLFCIYKRYQENLVSWSMHKLDLFTFFISSERTQIIHTIFCRHCYTKHAHTHTHIYIHIKFQRKMINSSWVGTPRTFWFFKEKTRFLVNFPLNQYS